MYVYKEIERRLISVRMSTKKRLILKNESYEFKGMNSPYVSHQECIISRGHGKTGIAIMENDTGFIVLVNPDLGYEIQGNYSVRIIPAFQIPRDSFPFPARLPEWTSRNCLVVIPDRFSGYDEGGKPLFEHKGEFSIDRMNILSLLQGTESEGEIIL